MRSKFFVPVLGMHRSGTSCLSGIVQEMGVHYHNASKWNRFNLKGNQENDAIVAFHDDLLRLNGCDWACLDATGSGLALDLGVFDFEVANTLLMHLGSETDVFGFKDPRTILFWDCWRSLCDSLAIEVMPIGIYRDPRLVAASLTSRDKLSKEEGFEIWAVYNKKMLDVWAKSKFPLLCFSLFPDAFDFELQIAYSSLDRVINFGHRFKQSFFTTELVNQTDTSDELPKNVDEVLQDLHEARFEWLARETSRCA